MELFVLNEVVAEWEAQLAQASSDAAPMEQLLSLCWHLRQRDPARALHWMAIALSRAQPGQAGWLRLDLIEAEIASLRGDTADAQTRCTKVLRELPQHPGDSALESDVHALEASLHMQAGHSARALQSLTLARACAQQGGDALRVEFTELWAAMIQTYQDPVAGKARGAPNDAQIAAMPTGLAAWAHELRGTLAAQASDYGHAAADRILAYDENLQTGQVVRAIVAALNAAAALNTLNEYELSLQWLEQAMALARRTDWPLHLANCLSLMGETQRCLGQFEAARDNLNEALSTLERLPRGRSYTILLKYLGELEMSQDRPEAALQRFSDLQQRAQADSQPDMLVYACRGQAQALAKLGRAVEAVQRAHQALQLARDSQNVYRQIDALRALATLPNQQNILPSKATEESSGSLHYLQQALDLAQSIPGFLIPGALWEELAQAHAQAGDLVQAYALLQKSGPAYRLIQSDAANKRMLALQVLQQAERARVEARALREAQAKRQQEERLAAMSRMVAGVAHELNTPIGNCLVVASTLQNSSVRVADELQAQTLKRSEMQAFLKNAQQASDLLMQSLTRAAQLVQRFKQVAVDPNSERLQRFDLQRLCASCIDECRAQSELRGVQLIFEVPAGLMLESYPMALQQVLTQLLANALQHAFRPNTSAWLRLSAKPLGEQHVHIEVCDNGQGIAQEHQSQVFDAFYSTRFGQGGSGLGLHICHNLLTSVLGGSIRVKSKPGEGCCFELSLPRSMIKPESR